MAARDIADRAQNASRLLAAAAELLTISARSIAEVAKLARQLSDDLKGDERE